VIGYRQESTFALHTSTAIQLSILAFPVYESQRWNPACLRSSIGCAPTFDIPIEEDFVVEKPTTIHNPAIVRFVFP